MNDWYRDSFGKDYLDIYAHRDAVEGRDEARAIVDLLGLTEGRRVLDVACGTGRHSLALESTGVDVTGVDLSLDLLQAGRRVLDGDNHLFVRGDMRALPFRASFDAVVSLFTSFGYFPTEAEDRIVLEEIHTALRPGGVFLLDFLNQEKVVRELVPHSEESRGNLHITQQRSISRDGRRVEKTIRVVANDDDSVRTFRESVRLYDREMLEATLHSVGMAVERALGSFAGEPAGPDTPRLILIARRTA